MCVYLCVYSVSYTYFSYTYISYTSSYMRLYEFLYEVYMSLYMKLLHIYILYLSSYMKLFKKIVASDCAVLLAMRILSRAAGLINSTTQRLNDATHLQVS